MTGKDLPKFHEDDASNESTVAMEAPSFEASVPPPVSDPPPLPAAEPAGNVSSAARAPAPAPARAPGVPPPGAPRPGFAGAPPRPASAPGAPRRGPAIGKSTVIGLAPPGPRPPAAAPIAAASKPLPKPADLTEPDDIGEGATVAADLSDLVGALPPSPSSADAGPRSAATLASASGKPNQNEVATVAVGKDVLERVRANPKAVLEEDARATAAKAGAKDDDEEGVEPTRAVLREELVRLPQDAHVVVGAGADGDDATLAVAPSSNDAAVLTPRSLFGDVGLPGAPDAGVPLVGGAAPPMAAPPPAFAPAPMGPSPMGPNPTPAMGMSPPMGGAMPGGWAPGQPFGQGPGGAGHYPGPGPGAGAMPQAAPFDPRQPAPSNWGPPHGSPGPATAVPAQPKVLSGQMILLGVVGFICLVIFVTGVVLFVTTKF